MKDHMVFKQKLDIWQKIAISRWENPFKFWISFKTNWTRVNATARYNMSKVIVDIAILSKQSNLRIKHVIWLHEVNLLWLKIIFSHNLFHVRVSKWLINLIYNNFIKFSVILPAIGFSSFKVGTWLHIVYESCSSNCK